MSKIKLYAIPVVFLVLGLSFGSRQFHWDTLERAYLLEHYQSFLKSWDGSPRSQFLSFAHVLELPLAAVVRVVLRSASGMQTLIVFEALCAALALLLVGRMILHRTGGPFTALAAQAVLACCWGFWKMGTSGEERILGLATLLLFLSAFWHALHAGKRTIWVSFTLVLAILSHLSNGVLVPFALLALLLLPESLRAHRRRVSVSIVMGAGCSALLYAAVAAWTTAARTPGELWEYLTFFHRDTGNNFLVMSHWRQHAHDMVHGLRLFLAEPRFAGLLALATLVLLLLWAARRRQTLLASMESRQLLLLAGLWSLHFIFYEPGNIESWTVVVTCLIVGVAFALPSSRHAWWLASIALLLGTANATPFHRLHQPMSLALYHRQLQSASAPHDIILLGGGIQQERPLQGSLTTRFFLAHERDRTIVSLYDVLQITQPEYWGRPIASVEALQQQIDAGRHVWFPASLQDEFARAQQSGMFQMQTRAHGDSLVEVLSIQRLAP